MNNYFSEYLFKEGYKNDYICPCVFINKANLGFSIIVVYVDDLNIIKILEKIPKVVDYLKKEFEMKILGKTKFGLNL